MALIAKLILIALALYVFLSWGAQVLQRRLMYFPDDTRTPPASVGLGDVEEVQIETPDGAQLIAWWGKAATGKPTLLYFHGNAGALDTRSERIRTYLARGYGVFMLAYRGFGGSTGDPSEKNNVVDGKLAYETLRSRGVAADMIVLYGESLGSGVAVQVAAEKAVAGVILDAPYTSMVDLAELHHPLLPSRWFMTDRYETVRHIGRVSAPLLIVHGDGDEIIPVAMGERVRRAAKGPAEIVVLRGAGHSDHYMFGSYEAIWDWLERLIRNGSQRAAE